MQDRFKLSVRSLQSLRWWVWEDSNLRPHPYQGCALPTGATDPIRGPASGGASRDRTDDPLLAKQVLSQLSYGPDNAGREQHTLRCVIRL